MNYEIAQPMKIVEYSERCLAIIGDTKPFKEDLKKMGCRFNYGLRCGPGWIFPVKKRTEVQKYVESKISRHKQMLLEL